MLEVIFEDDDLLVLSKPAGQTINRAETTRGEVTLQDEIEDYLNEQLTAYREQPEKAVGRSPLAVSFLGRAGIVHRLDKETSGILVAAKNPESFEKLQSQFKERRVEKEYLALVHGETPREGTVEAPLARHPRLRGLFGVLEGGRESVTNYRREVVYRRGEESYSLVRVQPKTGRTHQIRVHFKHLGYPVVSDPLYLSPKRLKQDRLVCPRLFLHAAALSFTHPRTGARMRFEAELPEDLRSTLARLAAVES